ncbi:transglycosylase domain-containing protein [Hellea balneolensis]|uniref:transglycosylase domain-containing protein n=1 Tax=Hellea balneolensis TaxID=287478 RepID=UPI0004246554|nr:PBP1A family penicillin-binding protein [Hellea balneolensis]
MTLNRKILKRFAARLSLFGATVFYALGMAVLTGAAFASKDLPSAETLWAPNRPVSVQIVDRYGRDVLVRGASSAPKVKLTELPAHVPAVVLATEDKRFKTHIGVDPYGLIRAMTVNLKERRYVQGGSTLTQQLTKNVFLTPDKTLRRKAQEMMISIWLEQTFTKDEILEMYLSRVYFGSGAWGLEAASQTYLGKSSSDLSFSESAMMAALLKAPSRFNPTAHPDRAAKRTALVIGLMVEQGLISRESQLNALMNPIDIQRPQSDNSAQYFVDWMWDELELAIGTPVQDIVVQTTLDYDAQLTANQAVAAHIDHKRHASQAALVSMDGTGGVMAMIGGLSYTDSQFNRAVQAERQPGSAFKPFVYLAAFKAGLTPWDIREDAPIEIGDWAPENFTEDFKGAMRLEDAFRQSINTVAVSLGEEVGREAVINTARDFGFSDLKPLRSLSLGAQATTPLKLTAAYLPFSNYGKTAEPYGILSVSTADGTPLYDRKPQNLPRIITAQNLAHMNVLMTSAVSQGTGRRAAISGRHLAGKTGTTNDFKDAWFVGYAPDIVTGVWVGNDDYTSMKGITGGTIPAMIWHDYMDSALETMPKTKLPVSSEPVWRKQEKVLDALLNDIEDALP